jgi:DNA-binding LytR/AlgR family response regulator
VINKPTANMINCIIVDDQQEAIDVIQDHLNKFSQVDLGNVFTDPIEGLKYLKTNPVDLVFLDIEMPNLNGLEFIESLKAVNGKNIPKFIFTTGHHKYALSGIEHGAIDFLVKPISFKRFNISIERFIDYIKNPTTQNSFLNKDYFFVELGGAKFKIKYSDIVYIEGDRNYIHIVEEKAVRKICRPMHYIENLLRNYGNFIRVHKSFIVSDKYVEQIKVNDIVMNVNGAKKTISIGKTYKDSVLKKFNIAY